LLARGGLIALVTLALTGWYLLMVYRVTNDPSILTNTSQDTVHNQPDLLQFITPVYYSRLLGDPFTAIFPEFNDVPHETAVFLSWTVLALSLIGFLQGGRSVRQWVFFSLIIALIALGPDLKINGKHYLEVGKTLIPLPYAWIQNLPGLKFMRTPGRFMLAGEIGFQIAAGFGIAWLRRSVPGRVARWVVPLALGLILIEGFPRPWVQTHLRPVPDFYQQMAQDPQVFGVFDLPLRPVQAISYYSSYVIYSSYYQLYQMTHGKGIATGYIDRMYARHPVFGQYISNEVNSAPLMPGFQVNGQPVNRYTNLRYELARNGYRYVVVHKPQPGYRDYEPDDWGWQAAHILISEVFDDQKPLVDDSLVTVYAVGTEAEQSLSTVILPIESLQDSWIQSLEKATWLETPVRFYLASAVDQDLNLVVTLRSILNRCSTEDQKAYFAAVSLDEARVDFRRIIIGKPAKFRLPGVRGGHTLSLSIQGAKAPNQPECFLIEVESVNILTNP
jgi:hypothetical protein